MAGQDIADLLSGAAGAPVDRPKLDAYVANSQSMNGLRSAQTDDALLKAQDMVDEANAKRQLFSHYVNGGMSQADAATATTLAIAHMGNANEIMQSLRGNQQLKADYALGDPAQTTDPAAAVRATLGQQVHEGKLAAPVAVPPTFVAPPGSVLANQPVQQTAVGQALTGLDVSRAEELHAKAVTSAAASTNTLSPDALHMAALTVMADPTKISGFTAGGGVAADAKKTAIQNEIAHTLNISGMQPEDMIRQRAITKASIGSAANAAKQAEVLDAFTPLVHSNGARILTLTQQMTPEELDLPWIDGVTRAISRVGGSPDAAELNSLFGTYQTEVARLIAGSPNMTGVISDKARGDVQQMVPTTMTARQAERVVNRINTEIDIRRNGVQQALESAAGAQLPVTSSTVNTRGGATGSGISAPGAAPGSARLPSPVPGDGSLTPDNPLDRNVPPTAANPMDDVPAGGAAPGGILSLQDYLKSKGH